MQNWWLSSKKMTVGVTTNDDDIIIDGAPITQRFKGQKIDNLIRWMKKQGGLQVHKYVAMSE